MARPLSISLRLGLLFAAIAGAVCVAVGAYLYSTLSRQMEGRDDTDLLNKAVLVRQLLHTVPRGGTMPGDIQAVLGRVIGQDGVNLRVAAPDGRILLGEPAADGDAPPPVPAGREPEARDIASREGPGGPTRVLHVLAPSGGVDLNVSLMRMRSDRLAVLKRYALDLLGALLAGTLVATALGFVAVRRGLTPLVDVAAKANDINAQRLNTRLAPDGAPAELVDFCLAFNAMLDRLEEGVQRLSGFAADLAHDLRTPVNALMVQTQVALSRERTVEEYQALLASNHEEYERLARMIENTLFLARVDSACQALRRDRLDLDAELRHICEYFEILAEDKQIRLTLDAGTPPTLEADPVLLRRAVNNLVSNAVEHTPAGGRVCLRARVEGAWLALSVANTGPGIDAAHRDRLFERYYRADPARVSGSSAGLGLAIVRAIMQLHGGTVRLDASGDGDTVFTLRFPHAPA